MASARIPQVVPWLEEAERAAVGETVAANWITEGPKAAAFSARLNDLIGVEYGVFAPNGTLALALGLMALGVGAGDEVLVPDVTFIGSATAVLLVGATPVFVEVNRDNFQIDVGHAATLVNQRTRAVMPVHLYGMCCDMDAVMALAGRHGLWVIEDAAQAVGVRYKGRHAGSIGDVGCFSFFADKTITTGEGGYVVCRDEAVHEALRLLRNQGRLDRGSFVHPAIGYNFRITDMQAAVGLAQIGKLDDIVARKLAIMAWYRHGLAGLDALSYLTLEPGSSYVPFRMVVLCDGAKGLARTLEDAGVEARGFFYPMHQQPCFDYLDRAAGGPLALDDEIYPNAIHGYQHGLCLPIFPTLGEDDVGYVCHVIRDHFTRSNFQASARRGAA